MEWQQYVNWGLTLLVGGFLWNKIRAQNALIKTQKEILETIKTYTSIINIDELKKYDEFRKEAVYAKSETEAQKIALEKYMEFIDRFYAGNGKDEFRNIVRDGLMEYIRFSAVTLNSFEPEKRNGLIKYYFKNSEEEVKAVIGILNKRT